MTNRNWTTAELDILRNKAKYPLDIDALVKEFKRSRSSIYGKIQRLGLDITNPNCNIDEECFKIIAFLYAGESLTTACDKLGINREKFKLYVNKNSILKEKYKNYKINSFKCYNCSVVFSKDNLYFSEDYQYKLCLKCGPEFKGSYRNTLNGHLAKLVVRARKYEAELDFDVKYLKELFYKQNGLCFYSKLPIRYTSISKRDFYLPSLDKMYPDLGYKKSNIALCCSGINRMKNELNPEEFFRICKIIYDNNNLEKLSEDVIR